MVVVYSTYSVARPTTETVFISVTVLWVEGVLASGPAYLREGTQIYYQLINLHRIRYQSGRLHLKIRRTVYGGLREPLGSSHGWSCRNSLANLIDDCFVLQVCRLTSQAIIRIALRGDSAE